MYNRRRRPYNRSKEEVFFARRALAALFWDVLQWEKTGGRLYRLIIADDEENIRNGMAQQPALAGVGL